MDLPSYLKPLNEVLGSASAEKEIKVSLATEAAKAGLVPAQVPVPVQGQADKLRFLIVGTHAHQYTGYSKVTYNMVKELAKESSWLDVTHYAIQRHPEIPPLYRPYPPTVRVIDAAELESKDEAIAKTGRGFGFHFLPDVIRKEKPHVVMIYNDLGIVAEYLEYIRAAGVPRTYKLWVYLDQVFTMQPQQLLDILNRDADRIFTFTSYWKKTVKEQGINRPVDVLTHGFDKDTFKTMSRSEARKLLSIPEDAFLYLSLNRNTPRKRYDLLIMAFAELIVKYPTKPIYLLCICDRGNKGGYLIFEIFVRELKRLGAHTDQFMSRLILTAKEMSFQDSDINVFYNAADVGVSTAEGEGFGLCNFEQMGIGVPQVIPDIGGFKEYCKADTSTLVKPKHRAYLSLAESPIGGEVEAVDPHDFCLGMEAYLNDSLLRSAHGAAAKKAVGAFEWPVVLAPLVKRLKEAREDDD